LLIIFYFVLCFVRFVIRLVVVMMVEWGMVCVIFFGCLDVGEGYVLAIGVYFERSSWCIFDVVFFWNFFLDFWYLFCVNFIFVVLEVEGWYLCRLIVFYS
jgi:hypothetical protein